MSFELKGKVIEVMPTQQVTDSLKKREIIVEYAANPQYPEEIKFECIQDKCALLDSVRPGQGVEVFFNLKGRKWTDKTGKTSWFNSNQLWKINVVSTAQNEPAF